MQHRASFLFLLLTGTLLVSDLQADEVSQRRLLRALDAELAGDTTAALEQARAAVAADASDADAQYHLGRLELRFGTAEAALPALEAAAAAGRPAPIEQATALRRMGRASEAELLLAPLVEASPDDGELQLVWAGVLADRGKDEQAFAAYSRASIEPELTTAARLGEAWLHLRRGDREEALQAARRAVDARSDPESTAAARAFIRRVEGPRRWSFRIGLGHQTDSNVILAQTDQRVAEASFDSREISDRVGNRWVAQLGGEYRFRLAEGMRMAVGYQGYQSYHRTHRESLQRYDVGAHTAYLRWSLQKGRLGLRAPARVSWVLLGPLFGAEGTGPTTPELRLYSRSLDVAPELRWTLRDDLALGGTWTLSAVNFTEADRSVFVGEREVSLVRSHLANALDLFVSWRWLESGELRPSLGFVILEAWGQVNAWEHTAMRARLRLRSPDFAAEILHTVLTLDAARRSYDEGFPVVAETGLVQEDRTDTLLQGTLALRARIAPWFLELNGTMQRNQSTVALFDYQRTILGAMLGAEF